jgi:hypothetical protein
LKTLTIGGIREERFVDDFAGVRYGGVRVEAPEYGAETAATDFFGELVLGF